jgi:hypothetical protein
MRQAAANATPVEVLLEIVQQSLPRPLGTEGHLLLQLLRSVCLQW